ncbi:VRR-NUC domain-containing protein [Undibacterium sp. RTI2.1]|uniref:VRR-NUC domain-containing protein n=1 Tax=unclassified Undibacterium TaxID=2630295 RepID=UPI002B223089|nr:MULTISPECIES: VRR-NUC domain-containing protein [unclassified Undibacterium]MEB0033142.1 VRR-NUC domain-containing protein [Undibacterium sp. RTI2.1]MEB0118941.1 VRR-NUC domain-containing protein [Undibacterium sp. RTI2.2]
MKQVLPNPLYYLCNFQLVLDWVSERYDDVLIPEERTFIADFGNLPQASQALFVRTVMRKGDYFRQSKLSYLEIGDTHQAMLPLIKVGWINPDPILTLDQLFELLQKPEIVALFSLIGPSKQLRKAEQLDYLRGYLPSVSTQAKVFSAWHPSSKESVVHIQNKALCDRLRLIFFGNWQQDWSEFVLSDLGIYRYEAIPFSMASRGFQTRRDIEDYIALQACRDLFHAEEPIALVLGELAKTTSENDWINRRRDKLLFQLGQQAEKQKDWDQALAVYEMSRYPGARLRTIRVLEKTGQSTAALQLLNEALITPESDAELQQLQRSAPRLNRKLGYQKPVTSTMSKADIITLRLPYPDTSFYVEGVVKDYLMQEEAPVYYVENTLINSLFGLLCWTAIFKPIPGAFFHPFHRGPVDLTSADFHQRRQSDFAVCLAQLDSDDYRTSIRQTYQAKQGIQSPFVFWGALDEDLLNLALTCIPAQHLRHWFHRILSDIKANRNGFPDLIQFWPKDQRYNMIEVKGPGDRLQDNQQRLIDYCTLHQMPISVCYLEWLEETQ